jgi:hypothetical protein
LLNSSMVLRMAIGERLAAGDSAMIAASADSRALAVSPVLMAITAQSDTLDVCAMAVTMASSSWRSCSSS